MIGGGWGHGRVIGALALVAAAVALLSACSGGSTPPSGHHTLTAVTSGGAKPAGLAPSGSASDAPAGPVRTVLKQFAPLDASGTLTAPAHPGGTGSCFSTSIAVPLSGVYRCLSGNTILDPCFAPVRETSPATVVCFADPWTSGVVLTLKTGLPNYAPDLTAGDPWAIELGNGARCVAVTGAVPVLGNVALTYRCGNGSVAGLTTAGDGDMLAHYGPAAGPLQDVGVQTAWRGRSYRLAGTA